MSDLVLDGVRKVFATRGRPPVEAVAHFDLNVRSGELVGLLGPSGCGKSTTLRMIAGLEDVTGGDIRVGGRSVLGLRPQRRNIGVAFENYALYPPLSVADNISFGLRARGGLSARACRERVQDLAERIGLRDILDARPVNLSSGQKQRVALARAIAREPEVLLLDEPLSHLDAAQRDLTRRELRRLQRELGYTTVLVTHDQEEALSLADRVVVMEGGRVRQVGTPDEVYDDPADLFVAEFVGEPAMNLLTGLAGPGRIVGVRPEDVAVVEDEVDAEGDGARGDVTGVVVVVEDFCEYGLLTVELAATRQRLVVQTGPGPAQVPGEAVGLAFQRDRTYMFDTTTGDRVR
ncbi:ABC transporter ATP-binding protein [Actinopolymorpha singaporensis]|uniref:ABC-type sugar transport system, ATPase component n=1 Tax=Actinopolymorpha singaporensis TaxID=117157 RepID=A0A1H1YGE7_9ACTN|nr:ABC transporter ATP-binding protein [Actinopolymorpha singaporensis]SDT20513.1 ABC-type sugar transport system, ATPase component [Actinopolymorpha singaporensis]